MAMYRSIRYVSSILPPLVIHFLSFLYMTKKKKVLEFGLIIKSVNCILRDQNLKGKPAYNHCYQNMKGKYNDE